MDEDLLKVVVDARDERVPEIARACLVALGAQLRALKVQLHHLETSTEYLRPIGDAKNRNTTPAYRLILRLAGRLSRAKEFFAMCDYSLHSVRRRPAKVGDKLVTRDFGTGTRGFASVADLNTAVCVLPGTELAFASEVSYADWSLRSLIKARLAVRIETQHRTAIFRQINKETVTYHDALEFPDGQVVLLTRLSEGQEATVLQLPASPRVAKEAGERKTVAQAV